MSTESDFDAMATQTLDLANELAQLLKGRPREIQGATLAELLSRWLAGHQGPDIDNERERLLHAHVELVRQLLPSNDVMVKKQWAKQ